jgi:Fe-S-cluster containining protein
MTVLGESAMGNLRGKSSKKPGPDQSDILALMQLPQGDTQLVQIMDAALAEAARKAGPWLACRPGCTQCCHGAFAISPLDALRLSAGMDALRTANSALAAEIERRAQAWVAEFAAGVPGDAKTGLLGDSDAEQELFEEFANEAACPALDPATGRCDVYAWRPMTCRVFGPPVRMGDGDALGCCELCFVGADEAEIAACEMPLPHELEARLLDEIPQQGDTVVAFALLR